MEMVTAGPVRLGEPVEESDMSEACTRHTVGAQQDAVYGFCHEREDADMGEKTLSVIVDGNTW